jgi:hypothetical protein
MVPVLLKVAVPRRHAWDGSIFLLLFVLVVGSSTRLAAETSPLDHSKPTASVAPPPNLGSPKGLDATKQKGSDSAACPPAAEPGKDGDATAITPTHRDAAGDNDNEDASSPSASDLTVRLPPHEELEKDGIRLPADAPAGAAGVSQDKEEFQVGLKDKDKDKESVPANAAGSPAQCSVPSATTSAAGSPAPR